MNKIIRKKCLSIVLTMAMVMSLFPAVTLPAKALPPSNGIYDVYNTFTTPVGSAVTGPFGDSHSQWDSAWSSLTYDGGTIGGSPSSGITMLGSSQGCFIDLSQTYATYYDSNAHWFKVTADNVNVTSFILTGLTLQTPFENDAYSVTVTGTLPAGGTVSNSFFFKPGNTNNTSVSGSLTAFSGIQITSFQISYIAGSGTSLSDFVAGDNNGATVSSFTFVDFTISSATNNAAPVVTTTGSTTSYIEDGLPVVIDSGIAMTDSDNTTLASATVTISGGFQSGGDVLAFTNDNATTFGNVSGSYNAGTGTLTLTSSGATATLAQWQSVLKAVTYANTSQDPTATNRTISFAVSDGTASSNTATKAVSVIPVNNAPTFSATGSNPTYTENGSAVALFSGTVASTIEAGQTITSLVLTVINVANGANEILNIDGTDVALTNGNFVTTPTNSMSGIVSVAGSTATVMITKPGGILAANMQTLVNRITYRNSSENPTTTSGRVITLISIQDNGGTANGGVDTTSLSIASTVTIVVVNDAPVLTTSGGTTAYTEKGAPIAIDSGISAIDVDNSTLASATVSITEGFQSGADVLALELGYGNIISSYNAGTGVLTITCADPKENITQWQAALRAVKFSSTSNNPVATKTITFVVNDGSADSAPATKSISITRVNDAPTITSPGSIAVTEDVASALIGISFSDIDVGGASVTVTLSVPSGTLSAISGGGVTVGGAASAITLTGSVSDINAFISGSNLTFTTTANATADVTLSIVIDDGGNTGSGGAQTALTTVTLAVTALNDAPSFTKGGDITVLENCGAQSIAGWATSISAGPADESGQTLSFNASNDNNDLFSVQPAIAANGTLTFTPTANANGTATVTVTLHDDGGTANGGVDTSAAQTFTITINNVNDTPTDIGLSSTSVPESAGIGTTVGNLSTADPDAADTFTYTLVAGDGSADNASFTMDGNVLKTNTTFSYATKNSYSIRVRTTDGGGLTLEKVFVINITEVNQNPTDIVLSATSINENLGANSTVGTLSTTDANATDTFTYTLVSGDGSTDNASFTILGNALRLTGSGNYEENSSYSVRIRTTDAGGLWYEEAFTITISDLNEAPTDMTLSASAVNENVAGNTIVGTLSSADPDAGNTFTYTLVSGDGDTDNASFNISGNSLRITNSPNYETKNSYSVRVCTTDQGGLTYEKTFAITINNLNEAPAITTGATVSVTEGSTAAFTAAATDPEGSAVTWSITGGADQAKFSIVAGTGVVTFVTAPVFGSPTDADANNTYVLQITASDGALTATQTATVTVTKQPSSGGSNTTAPPTNTVVEVNGQKQDAGTASTQTTGGQTVTTIKVDDTKLNKILTSSGEKPTVTLPTNKASDVVVGELNGQTIKNMEQKEAVLEIKTETVSYTLPAAQINIDDVSSQIGEQVALKDIKVSVKIAAPPADTVKIVENTAAKNSYQIVVKPVDFEITCTSGSKTVAVSKFNGYVERTVAIPDGVDPSKITTGIVLNNDGTFSHVPTQIVVINGKYFAKINSLTNSTYSVIYNPVTFADVASHWAKEAINDMGSRMVVTGIGNSTYEPERNITRAEFAAIVVSALGLRQGTEESSFGDVTLTDWFNGYVDTATDYALITGYDSGTFGPSDTITREQAMAIIARAMKLTELSENLTDKDVGGILEKYTDGAAVSDYAKLGVAACVKSGIVSGTSESTLSPKAYVTRAEVAVMVQHLLEKSGLI